MGKNIAISLFSIVWKKDWDKTVAASLRNRNKGVLPVRSSLLSWKTLISAKSANYFECVPDRDRIKIRPGRFWPGGPRKIPNAETNWTLSQSEEEPIQRRMRNNSKQDQRNELVRGFAAVSGGAEFEIQKRRWPFVSHVRFCYVEPSNSVLQICQLFRDKSWQQLGNSTPPVFHSSMFRLIVPLGDTHMQSFSAIGSQPQFMEEFIFF